MVDGSWMANFSQGNSNDKVQIVDNFKLTIARVGEIGYFEMETFDVGS